MALTEKHKRFAEEYLKDFNATAAYQRAGYEASTAAARANASRLLANANIQAYLCKLRSRVAERAEITLESTVREIAKVAFCNIVSVCEFGAAGVRLKESSELSEDATAAIELVKSTPRGTSVRMHNKIVALTLLADYFGVRDDFNKARQTLYRYGLNLQPDESAPAGWKVYPVGFELVDAEAADRAVEEFFAGDGDAA